MGHGQKIHSPDDVIDNGISMKLLERGPIVEYLIQEDIYNLNRTHNRNK